jgi:predicted secreted hydrolase
LGAILANPTPLRPPIPTAAPTPTAAADPQPVSLPADDAVHNRLTEWWYYTGHLTASDGRQFGFEFVVFRAERGGFPVSWASHLALTDEAAGKFAFDQRAQIGPAVDQRPAHGFDLAVGGLTPAEQPWLMSGSDGVDHLQAGTEEFSLDLDLHDKDGAVLHGGIGWVDFGPAGSSYYYSRPRMEVSGTLRLSGTDLSVTGTAWFDHQWGDFIAVGGGGWDWFAINLDDGADIMISLVRAADGTYPLIYGEESLAGNVTELSSTDFTVTPTARWTSPTTGADYPAGWKVDIPKLELTVHLTPTVADQELDTRATTNVVYWEGSQIVDATRAGQPVGGKAYVELTGYFRERPAASP